MSEIFPSHPTGEPTADYQKTMAKLAESLVNGECLIFLGAGASVDLLEQNDLPTATELSVASAPGGSWGGQRLSMGDYVTGTGAPRGAGGAGGG